MSEKIEIILVDIGNTRTKSAEVRGGRIAQARSWDNFNQLNNAYQNEVPFIICSTGFESIKRSNTLILSHETPIPITLDYETPETLGADRIAAAVGANVLFPNTNSLIADLGTCMTIDFITEEEKFIGGTISPGLTMRMKSMAHYTTNLPDISSQWEKMDYNILGKSTRKCLLSGAFGGIMNEIEGTVAKLKRDFTSINVILSGGDARHFEYKLKAYTFVDSKVVFVGLYQIWKHQFKR
ncbi:MAG: type III pantothenate kinase [Bacteroidota bacterium]